MIDEFIKSAENASYAIVCKLIDMGLVESEPEGLALEHEFTKIIRDKFGLQKINSYICTMKFIAILKTNRSEYDANLAANNSISVKELIRELEQIDEDAKIVFSNDNGQTYGYIDESCVDIKEIETEEDIERRKRMGELAEELTELLAEYENDYFNDKENIQPMTDEEYRKKQDQLFADYNITREEFNNYNFQL